MDKQLDCDFYITYWKNSPFKQMNYDELTNLKKTSQNIKVFGSFYWQKNVLHTVFKPYKYYILIGNPFILNTWLFLIFAKILGKKTYLWTHGWYGNETFLKRLLKRLFFSLSTKILLYGDYARNLMIEIGFSHQKLICIYNSLDYNYQLKIREKLKQSTTYFNYFKNEDHVLLYIGRIQKTKKIDLLIDALDLLNVNGIKCNLVIIGKDEEDTKIEKHIDKNQSKGRIWLYGACYDEEIIGELIFNAQLCVSPGNVGLTAMHSLVYGTPVITHNNFSNQCPEFEAIIDGKTGSFFKEDSAEDLANKISLWLSKSSEEREVARKNCHQIINEKYNPQKQIDILKQEIV